MRALAGAMIVIAAVVAALAIYTRVGDRTEVLAVRRPVLAGEQITRDVLQVVSISADESFPSLPATDLGLVVGQYARVRIASGSLLVADSIQPGRLVDPKRVLMSVVVPVGLIPVGLREQSRLTLVVTPAPTGEPAVPALVEAIVASVPRNLTEIVGSDESGRAMVALSVEVDPQWVSLVGSASAVSVGVLDPQSPFPDAADQLGVGSRTEVITASSQPPAGDVLYGSTSLPAASPTEPAVTGG